MCNRTVAIGWVVVIISTIIASWWAFWGTIENFHEGWYFERLWKNLGLTACYLTPMAVFIIMAIVSILWPKIGGTFQILIGLALVIWWMVERWPITPSFFIHVATISGVILALIGIGYLIGRPTPYKYSMSLIVIIPILVSLVCAIEPVWRISQRPVDLKQSPLVSRVNNNNTLLMWAPMGPGWPNNGNNISYERAKFIVAHLSEDGTQLTDSEKNTWRLPTVEELVGSLTRQGINAEGQWDTTNGRAHYKIKPDKESPLWNPYSPVIYWWTSTVVTGGYEVYRVCFNGNVSLFPIKHQMGSLGFRAVKSVKHDDNFIITN